MKIKSPPIGLVTLKMQKETNNSLVCILSNISLGYFPIKIPAKKGIRYQLIGATNGNLIKGAIHTEIANIKK